MAANLSVTRKKLIISCVGMQYRTSLSFRELLEKKCKQGNKCIVDLVREPENEYDENAVMVFLNDPAVAQEPQHIGYLMREIANLVADDLDSGRMDFISGRMTKVDPLDGSATLELKFKKGLNKPDS